MNIHPLKSKLFVNPNRNKRCVHHLCSYDNAITASSPAWQHHRCGRWSCRWHRNQLSLSTARTQQSWQMCSQSRALWGSGPQSLAARGRWGKGKVTIQARMITGSGTHLGVVIDDGIYQNIVAGRARQEERTPPPMIILREERKETSCTSNTIPTGGHTCVLAYLPAQLEVRHDNGHLRAGYD